MDRNRCAAVRRLAQNPAMDGGDGGVERLGAALRAERLAAGLTQQDLAEFAGVDRHVVAAIERGQVAAQVRRMVNLFDLLGLDLVPVPRAIRLAREAAADGSKPRGAAVTSGPRASASEGHR